MCSVGAEVSLVFLERLDARVLEGGEVVGFNGSEVDGGQIDAVIIVDTCMWWCW